MTRRNLTKRSNTVAARNFDVAQHGLRRPPYTSADYRRLAVTLSTRPLRRA
jgi:hypothetical protein